MNPRQSPFLRRIFLTVGTLVFLFPAQVRAGLDGDRGQIPDEARKLGLVVVRTGSGPGYTTLTLGLASGPSGRKTLDVREYLDPTGRVFAVAWQGSVPPDLSVLLGRGFARMTKASPPSSPDRHRLSYRDNRLVVEVSGTARFRIGRAWNPRTLPPGFSPSRIGVGGP